MPIMPLQGKKIGIVILASQLREISILRQIERMMLGGAEIIIIPLDKKKIFPGEKGTGKMPLDLLVIIMGAKEAFPPLEKKEKAIYHEIPLVLVPSLSTEETPSLNHLSSLLEKQCIYFVPFGPANRKEENLLSFPLYSRLDLLAETCCAALEGYQLKPPVWENCSIPFYC